ncbi:hypothetical protein [Methylomarinum vadi]|uniref:hypothetical protein n=1 Tax=Methylomarinum vadi TaxID=438855 RepID=UPI001F20FEC4|nr:hypothetical protein [Methylomarinum vadi]
MHHFNPVRHGHAARVSDWPYSSFHRYARKGWYPEGWGDAFVPRIEMPEAGQYD